MLPFTRILIAILVAMIVVLGASRFLANRTLSKKPIPLCATELSC